MVNLGNFCVCLIFCFTIFEEVEKIDAKENLTRLIQQYQNLVFSICLKLTGDYFAAEDLAQETFLSAYHHYAEFDGNNEKAWICRIASNKCIDYQRAAARRMIPTTAEEMPEELFIYNNEPFQKVFNHEVLEEFKQCCKNLPPPYDTIALQHFLEGKTAKEIAEQSNVSIHTIQTQIYRAREKLKKIYRKEMLME